MQPKIFFVHSGNETFVRLDREILSDFTKVQDFYAVSKYPVGFTQYWQGVRNSDLVFCWFASWNSLWALFTAKLLSKPSILVIGGYDLANIPEANYGQQRGGLGKWVSRSAIRLATTLFTNSFYSQREATQNAGIPPQCVQVIYHGVPDLFGDLPRDHSENIALTVGKVDWPNLKRKGLESFVRAAALLPEVQFIVVGAWADNSIEFLRSIASKNVTFTGRVSDEELLDYYRQASVYVQASLHEGFGLSVAEAMLGGCIPVVTKAGSLPEVVGEIGIYSDSSDPSDIARAIKTAFSVPSTMCRQARDRILKQFPMEKRKHLIEQFVFSVFNGEI